MHGDVDLIPTECPAVNRLSALPRITPEFPEELHELIIQARLGDNPGLKRFLERLSRGEFEWREGDEAETATT